MLFLVQISQYLNFARGFDLFTDGNLSGLVPDTNTIKYYEGSHVIQALHIINLWQ